MHVVWYAGADVHAADHDGNTALHIAARYGHELLINTLLQHDADILKYLLLFSAVVEYNTVLIILFIYLCVTTCYFCGCIVLLCVSHEF